MILYARLFLQFIRKHTRRLAQLRRHSIVWFAVLVVVTKMITVLWDRMPFAWLRIPKVIGV
jgi:hypothetical protein